MGQEEKEEEEGQEEEEGHRQDPGQGRRFSTTASGSGPAGGGALARGFPTRDFTAGTGPARPGPRVPPLATPRSRRAQ